MAACLMQRSAVSGEPAAAAGIPTAMLFSEADKKQALAEYASRLGLGPVPKASCEAHRADRRRAAADAPHPAAKPQGTAAQAKPVSFISPRITPGEAPQDRGTHARDGERTPWSTPSTRWMPRRPW